MATTEVTLNAAYAKVNTGSDWLIQNVSPADVEVRIQNSTPTFDENGLILPQLKTITSAETGAGEVYAKARNGGHAVVILIEP